MGWNVGVLLQPRRNSGGFLTKRPLVIDRTFDSFEVIAAEVTKRAMVALTAIGPLGRSPSPSANSLIRVINNTPSMDNRRRSLVAGFRTVRGSRPRYKSTKASASQFDFGSCPAPHPAPTNPAAKCHRPSEHEPVPGSLCHPNSRHDALHWRRN